MIQHVAETHIQRACSMLIPMCVQGYFLGTSCSFRALLQTLLGKINFNIILSHINKNIDHEGSLPPLKSLSYYKTQVGEENKSSM